MKNSVIKSLFFLALATQLVSCSHQMHTSTQYQSDREVASEKCQDSVRGEYHSYFDNVEKCIEKKHQQ